MQKISNRSQALAKGRSVLNRAKGRDTQRQQADDRVALVKDAIRLCIIDGAISLQAVADCLTSRNIPTARGGQWSPTAAMRVMQRLGLELNKVRTTSVSSWEVIAARLLATFGGPFYAPDILNSSPLAASWNRDRS
jgi:hypothetical protein